MMDNAVLSQRRTALAGLSLKSNFSWTLAGNVVYAGCQWGILSVLAKFGTIEMVGQFALGLAVASPVMVFSMLQLRAVQATDTGFAYDFVDYVRLRFTTTILALAAIGGIVWVVGYRGNLAYIILAVAMLGAIDSVSDVIYGLLQQHQRMDRIALSMMLKGLLSLAALAAALVQCGSVNAGLAAIAAAKLAILGLYDVPNARWVRKHIHSPQVDVGQGKPIGRRNALRTLLGLAIQSLPLGITAMLISLNASIPRYFIERILGERQLGIFAGVSYLMVVGSTVVCALGQAASPRLAGFYGTGNAVEFRSLMAKLIGIGAIVGGGGIAAAAVAGRPILAIIYQPEYAAYASLFVWIMVASAVSYVASMLGFGATACHRLGYQPVILVAATLTSLASCWILVPHFGMLGASLSMILSAVVNALCFGILLRPPSFFGNRANRV